MIRVHETVARRDVARRSNADEAEALSQLRPNIDGVIFSYDCRRATFLPQVWEGLPEPREFLARLKQKAGVPADLPADGVRLAVYQVERFQADEEI